MAQEFKPPWKLRVSPGLPRHQGGQRLLTSLTTALHAELASAAAYCRPAPGRPVAMPSPTLAASGASRFSASHRRDPAPARCRAIPLGLRLDQPCPEMGHPRMSAETKRSGASIFLGEARATVTVLSPGGVDWQSKRGLHRRRDFPCASAEPPAAADHQRHHLLERIHHGHLRSATQRLISSTIQQQAGADPIEAPRTADGTPPVDAVQLDHHLDRLTS